MQHNPESPASRDDREGGPERSVVYGLHPVAELIQSRSNQIDHIYFDGDRRSDDLFALMKTCRSLRLSYAQVPELRLTELARTNKHQGVVALCAVKAYVEIEEVNTILAASSTAPLVLIPASVEDPRNLGALIRSCAAFGAQAVMLERRNTAPLSATVAKASAGMIEHVTIARPRNLEGIVGEWARKGWTIVGADMQGDCAPRELDLTGPVVLILGGEHKGIPPYLRKLCSKVVRIPMPGPAPSLNVAVAGGVLLYECACQRIASFRDSQAEMPVDSSPGTPRAV